MQVKRYLTASVTALSAAIVCLLIVIAMRSVALPEAAAGATDAILELRPSLQR